MIKIAQIKDNIYRLDQISFLKKSAKIAIELKPVYAIKRMHIYR